MKSLHAFYEGRVQRVGFRASVLSLAKGFDVKGWVRNLSDGRVELFLSGDDCEIDDFLQEINKSHLAGHIEQCSLVEGIPEAGLRGFRIID